MKRLLLCGVLAFVSWKANGQTAPYSINQNHNGCCGGGANSGSSFLTLGAGQIDSIKVYNRSSQDYLTGNVVSVFLGNTTNAASLLHSEDAGVVHTSGVQQEVMIRFTNPVHVAAATTYTFYIEGFPTRFDSGSNTYADGTYWTETGEHPTDEMDFILYIGEITTTGIDNATNQSENYILYRSVDKILEASAAVAPGYELSLYDGNGNLISSANNHKLILSGVPQGVYVARLKSGNVIYTSKIMVQ
ncbi:MAG: hypothetical protein JWM14_317 [Chitinophagaceae bacterium]|nr:hypothetical protein [Chitinophagaceae bacterium]